MSFYVRRMKAERFEPTRLEWVGPIRSDKQAQKERDAWRECGWDATVFESSPDVRATVRAWQKEVAR